MGRQKGVTDLIVSAPTLYDRGSRTNPFDRLDIVYVTDI
jgi:hypothetical protein